MTQTIEYVVKVNATQAQAAVAEVEKRFVGVDTVVAKVDTRIIALEKDMLDLSAVIVKGGANVDAYKQALRNVETEMDRISGVVPQLSTNFGYLGAQATIAGKGTRNVGQAALEGSRALEDMQYGLAGVVNNIPGLIMSLGGGMGLTAAISLGAVAANQLYKNWDAISSAFGSSTADIKAVKDAIKGLGEEFDRNLNESLKDGRETLKNLREELRDFGQDTRSKDLSAQSRKIEGMESRLSTLVATREERAWKVRKATKEGYDEAKGILDETDRRIEALKKGLKEARGTFFETAEVAGAIGQKEKEADEDKERERRAKKWAEEQKKIAEETAKTRYDLHVAMLDDEDKALREVREARAKDAKKARAEAAQDMAQEFEDMDKERKEADRRADKRRKDAERAEQLHLSRLEQLEGESLAARMAFDTVAMNHKMDNLDKLKAHEFKNLKDNVKQYEGMYNDLGQLAQGATTTMIGASEDYFKAKIEGAENAEMIAAAAVLSGIGDQLVGLGTKYLFEGAGMSLLGDPRGPAMLGLGGLTIAAGVGMGAGSAAISHTAAGGTIGKALPDDKATKDPGASPRSSGGGGGSGGPLIVNVAYGAGGPLPEDIAREIHRVTSSGNRRRGAA
jgi:hypothetical protein